ncbi:chorismate--pyruvate lyase family protein [Phaeovulum vinaykumarii]|uniref:Chorismate lyase n=1 Tax=Phaeovulum vinaykumarii TaxID=407234 RepID=A0A1N7MMP0_9RHOB|nr:chorismate lyase [Phaeovulum vinaykumarii]SIS87393.1 chorismate lyase [Phaeovulum vinaykumarii]SOC13168.1 chorismate lyase [Phaeovulum vinaykumarii]
MGARLFHGPGDLSAPETWQDLNAAHLAALPVDMRGWMGLETSMTAALEVAAGPVTVELVAQGPAQPLPDETAILQAPVIAREVILSAARGPLLAARTIWPASARAETLESLGTKPLGALLFAGGRAAPFSLRQGAFLDALHPLDALIARAAPEAPGVWARRSLFSFEQVPLLVTEIFLPALRG